MKSPGTAGRARNTHGLLLLAIVLLSMALLLALGTCWAVQAAGELAREIPGVSRLVWETTIWLLAVVWAAFMVLSADLLLSRE